ncbi:MAG: site-specific DNA-methyltransferase [Candidatus Dormibacteria bacterium]
MAGSFHGRLELTWTNKDEALLWGEDGSYRWVPQSDFRVAEVRLLHDRALVGETHSDGARAADNLLIQGDALNALTSLARLPEFQGDYLGQVKLAYLDPPFNTQQAFEHYDDALEHSVWLTMLRDRLMQIRKLLSPDGSVWVHCDDSEQAYLKAMMDEVFGRENFVAAVLWVRRNDPRNTARHISTDHDYLLVFARDISACVFNQLPRTDEMIKAYSNPDDDPRGPWRRGDLAARNPYSRGLYPITTPSGRVITGPPSGSYWRVSKERLADLDADGRIYWGPDGKSRPYVKRFLSEVSEGRVPGSVWLPEEVGFVRNGKEEVRRLVAGAEPFATPKPEKLIQRVIALATNPGDIVLDCFLGSGTTAAVAQKMGRSWVGIERSALTMTTYALTRLEKVVAGDDPGGISGAVGWNGGGGFRFLEIAQSMFEETEAGIFLATWAVNGSLAQATAAQLGYTYAEEAPFCGRRGRSRLAVIDGLITSDVARLLANQADETDRIVLCGTAVADDAEAAMRELSPGSSVRKIPASILADYRRRSTRPVRRLSIAPETSDRHPAQLELGAS